jgi:hypothetical protein
MQCPGWSCRASNMGATSAIYEAATPKPVETAAEVRPVEGVRISAHHHGRR